MVSELKRRETEEPPKTPDPKSEEVKTPEPKTEGEKVDEKSVSTTESEETTGGTRSVKTESKKRKTRSDKGKSRKSKPKTRSRTESNRRYYLKRKSKTEKPAEDQSSTESKTTEYLIYALVVGAILVSVAVFLRQRGVISTPSNEASEIAKQAEKAVSDIDAALAKLNLPQHGN